MKILPWYILRLHLVPFLIGLGLVTFIFEMDVFFEYFDLVINRGVPVTAVLQLFALSLAFVAVLSVPCAVLVAELMTFGRLSQDNEITALRASGIHPFRAILPSLVASVLLAGGLVLFNNYVYPEANHAFAGLLMDIHRMRPTVKLQEGVFITELPGYNLLVRSVNGQTNEMKGVTIYQMSAAGLPRTILAKRGLLSYTPDGRTAVVELYDGEIHEIEAEAGQQRRYHRVRFHRQTIFIQGAGGLLERSIRDSRGDREKSASMLLEERTQVRDQYARSLELRRTRFRLAGLAPDELDALAPDRARLGRRIGLLFGALLHRGDVLAPLAARHPELRSEVDVWRMERDGLRKRMAELSVEIHKKFALPAACIVFVLIGAPIGMSVKRAGPAVAFVSVGFFVFYYVCLVGGEDLANRLILPPWLAMWIANLVLGALGIDLTARACEVRLPWHRHTQRIPAGGTPLPRREAAA